MLRSKATLSQSPALIALIVALGATCQSTSAQTPKAPSALCAPTERTPERFQITPAPIDDATATIEWLAKETPPRRITDVLEIEGPCATEIQGFSMGTFALRTGEGFAYLPDAGVQEWADGRRAVEPAALPPSAIPDWAGAQFISATAGWWQNNPDNSRSRWYLGLWRDSEGWIVARFVLDGRQSPSAPEPMLRSSLPVNGVAFLPAVDTNEGRVTILQRINDNKVRSIGFTVAL